MKNVLLFTDPGIDDSLAIIYCILNPQINLVGIVASYGNVPKEQAVENVNYLLEISNLQKIPVIRGAEGPLTGDISVYYPEIHGPEGLGPILPPETVSQEFKSFNEIFKIVATYENDLVIVDVGRNTTLAMALLLEPDIMQMANEYYMMGGAFLVPGNVTPVAEANVHGDPTATGIVLTRAKNITIFPLNVTNYAYVNENMAEFIQQKAQNPFRTLVPKIIEYYIESYKKLVPGLPGAPLHDVLTVSALVNPGLCSFIQKAVIVQDILGPAFGITIADFRKRAKEDIDPSIKTCRIAIQLNYQLFYQDFLETMTRKIVE
ncbi:nucleoside hydrolase [Alkalihalobacillus sp. AL-G]|uniref:nucleoside hydrolase n=1 Tax=Alkalihalobacillus sp. AL-G TaxID=2926399 RepID=UPI00272A4606|nr:nucleoside hydrolase [Alkalihalobacillus sp. AL-G]WLD91576.1 nucleoside hydrolase [Alkalihalobacillus sp. AL-G]